MFTTFGNSASEHFTRDSDTGPQIYNQNPTLPAPHFDSIKVVDDLLRFPFYLISCEKINSASMIQGHLHQWSSTLIVPHHYLFQRWTLEALYIMGYLAWAPSYNSTNLTRSATCYPSIMTLVLNDTSWLTLVNCNILFGYIAGDDSHFDGVCDVSFWFAVASFVAAILGWGWSVVKQEAGVIAGVALLLKSIAGTGFGEQYPISMISREQQMIWGRGNFGPSCIMIVLY